MRLFIYNLLIISLVIGGCTENAPTAEQQGSAQATDTASEVLHQLGQIHLDTLRSVFGRLNEYAYVRSVQTQLFRSKNKTSPAFTQEQRIRYSLQDGRRDRTVLSESQTGQPNRGWISRLVGPDGPPDPPEDPVSAVLPDDTPIVSETGPTLYRYHIRGDTAISGTRARVIEVNRLPGNTGETPITRARIYVEPESNIAIGLRVWREQHTVLFHERSRLAVFLQHGPDDQWVPARTRYQSTMRIPIVTWFEVRSQADYSDFQHPRPTAIQTPHHPHQPAPLHPRSVQQTSASRADQHRLNQPIYLR